MKQDGKLQTPHCQQMLEFFGMEDSTSEPTLNMFPEDLSQQPRSEQTALLITVLSSFLQQFGYAQPLQEGNKCTNSAEPLPTGQK